jgi:hypothetical protein
VLVDMRPGDNTSVILQHPLFNKMLAKYGKLDDRFKNYRITSDNMPDVAERQEYYVDPLGTDPEGEELYHRHWLARMEQVKVDGKDSGLVVIVQEAYKPAIGYTLRNLRDGLFRYGIAALVMITLVMAGLWTWTLKMSVKRRT